jgi:glycosyltransferase involved in cell wall biosynthesis
VAVRRNFRKSLAMRVVINATAALGARTGVGHYTVELIRALGRTKQVRIVLYPQPLLGRLRLRLGGGPKPVSPQEVGQPTRKSLFRRAARIPFRWGWRALVETELRRTLHPRRADLYHEPNFFPLPSRLPTVVTVHDLSAVLHPEWHPLERVKLFETDFLPRVREFAHILTDSDSAREEIIRTLNLPADRITRAYPGIRETLRPLPAASVKPVLDRLGLPANYFLHVGTLEPRKNLLMLLRAYTSLSASMRERCPLVLVGPWGWRFDALNSYFENEAKHRNVRHLGYVSEADLPAVYNGARALLFPTFYEGFGLPAAEMLACGGAVIASSTPAVAELLDGCGTILDPNDADAWRLAMMDAIEDADWLQHLRLGGLNRAAEFTWANCARDTLVAYRAALQPLRPA